MTREERFTRAIAAIDEEERTQNMAKTTGMEYDRRVANATREIRELALANLTAADLDAIDTAARQILKEAIARAYV